MLDRFLDLGLLNGTVGLLTISPEVIWGHEHECLIKPQQSAIAEFYVCQPGSTVATSLIEGESKPKY